MHWLNTASCALEHMCSMCPPASCALQKDIEAGQADLAQACSQSLAHGVLLALRYLTPLIPWQAAAADPDQLVTAKQFLSGLLQLLEQATELALPCLANPQDSNIGKACH